MAPLLLYSPKQVFVGSFLGGPIAAVYFLHRNFVALSKPGAARQTLWWGIVLNIALVAVIPFFPQRSPSYLLPLVYSWTARGIAGSKQLTKEQIAASSEFAFHSNWRVVGIAIGFLIGTVTLWFPIFLLFAYFRVGNLA